VLERARTATVTARLPIRDSDGVKLNPLGSSPPRANSAASLGSAAEGVKEPVMRGAAASFRATCCVESAAPSAGTAATAAASMAPAIHAAMRRPAATIESHPLLPDQLPGL
jgi:hypothetical protein